MLVPPQVVTSMNTKLLIRTDPFNIIVSKNYKNVKLNAAVEKFAQELFYNSKEFYDLLFFFIFILLASPHGTERNEIMNNE